MRVDINEEVKYGSDIINEESEEEPEPQPSKFFNKALIEINCHF